MGENVDHRRGTGVLCGAVCDSQGDQAQTNAHCGMRIFNRACECVDDCGAVGMRKRAKRNQRCAGHARGFAGSAAGRRGSSR